MNRTNARPSGARLNTALRTLALGLAASLSLALAACGGGGGTDFSTPAGGAATPGTPASYTVGGTVSGLSTGQTVALQNNGGGTLTVNANGAFTFAAAQQGNTAYNVTVSSQPTARSTCTVSSGTGTVGTGNVTNVAVSCVTQHFAYVVNWGNGAGGFTSVSLCNVNATTGALTGCASTGPAGLTGPTGIALSPNGAYAYVTDDRGNTLTTCSVNPATGALTGCAGIASPLPRPFGVALSPDGGHLFGTSDLGGAPPNSYTCSASGGTLSSCFTNPFFPSTRLAGITLSANGSYAYLLDYGANAVWQCSVGASGMLTGCNPTGTGFSNPTGITLSANGAYAYVTNGNGGAIGSNANLVTQCNVNTNGTLTNCVANTPVFDNPYGIALSADGQHAYVTNWSNSTVSQCSVSPTNGTLSGCTSTGGGSATFSTPAGVVFD